MAYARLPIRANHRRGNLGALSCSVVDGHDDVERIAKHIHEVEGVVFNSVM
jgi:hypothetical protein